MNQEQWEQEYRQQRLDKFQTSVLHRTRRGYITETPPGAAILKQQVGYIAEELQIISGKKTRGLGGKYTQVLTKVANSNWDSVAYIGLSTVLDKMFSDRDKNSSVSAIAMAIGRRLEQEHKLKLFNKANEDILYNIRNDLEVSTYKGKKQKEVQRVSALWEDAELHWEPWTTTLKAQIGLRIVRSVTRVMSDYIEIQGVRTTSNRKDYRLKPTESLLNFLDDYMEFFLGRAVAAAPCIEPPIAWERTEKGIVGGFHTHEARISTPFVKTKTSTQDDWLHQHYPAEHVAAVNHLQSVQWEINSEVLALVCEAVERGTMPEHLPPLAPLEYPPKPDDASPDRVEWGMQAHHLYKVNKKNAQKLLRIRNVISLAKFYEQKPFWFVYTCDFRGRIYPASPYLSPLGPDYVRGMLRFSEGKPLGDAGLKWLAVHGANCYGQNKISYVDRYKWVMDNMEGIHEVARDPHSSAGRSFLAGASKPFMFYAFAREWTEAHALPDPRAFLSHIPVTFDGRCNGFQHISALLCDRRGAGRTNLLASDVPQDLYRDVADTLTTLLSREVGDELGAMFLRGGITRELVKKPVLSIPYGVTIRGIALHVEEYINANADKYGVREKDLENWKYYTYIAPLIVEAAHRLVPSAATLSQWLQVAVHMGAMHGEAIRWVSPAGFPVYQHYQLCKEITLRSQLLGDRTFYFKGDNHGVNRVKADKAIVANFIHSMDASHLVMTINRSDRAFMAVHDEYGTHACDADGLYKDIREAFLELYIPDVMAGFKQQLEEYTGELPELPPYGSYDIGDICDARYFFA